MIRFLTIFAAIACFAVSIAAGYRIIQKPPPTPGFWAEPNVVQLNEHYEGETLRGTVRFRNTYPTPIHVLEWSSTCSCTGMSVTEREIPPGGETQLAYEWHIGSRKGRSQETLSILYHYGPEQVDFSSVHLRATVKNESICEPRQLEFTAGQANSLVVRFRPGRLKSVSFDEKTSKTKTFTATVTGDEVAIQHTPTGNSDDLRAVILTAQLSGSVDSSVAIPLIVQSAAGIPAIMPMAMPKE